MIGLKIYAEPTVEPISLAEAKAFLAIDTADTANDALITALIKAARRFCENYTNRVFITQTWDLWFDRFPAGEPAATDWREGITEGPISRYTGSCGVIEVPKAPLQSVVSLNTYGTDDEATAFDITSLVTNVAAIPGKVFLKYGLIWPTNLRPNSAICLRFKAGYGDAASSVPTDIIQAVQVMTTHFFENRDEMTGGNPLNMPVMAKILLDPYKVRSLR